jgi:hypothetical protein
VPRSFHSDVLVSKRNSLARLDLHSQYNCMWRLWGISLHLEANIFLFLMSLDLYLILIGESNDGLIVRIMLLFLQDG